MDATQSQVSQTAGGNYDTPVGVGGTINNNTGALLNAPPVSQTQDAASINGKLSGGSSATIAFPNPPADQSQNNTSTLGAIQPTDLTSLLQNAQAPTQTDQNQSKLTGSIQQLLAQIKGLGGAPDSTGKIDTSGALTGAQDQAAQGLGYKNMNDVNTQLTGINNQIQALQKEAQAIPLQDQQDVLGRGVTEGGLAPIEAGKIRENTIKALGLSSIAQTLQGNISLAQDIASKAVDAEFKPYQLQLSYDQQLYNMNKDQLTREDAKQATALQAQLQERQRVLGIQEDNRKTGYALANAAAANNPGNQAAMMAIQKANGLNPQDPNYLQEISSLLSPYQSNPLDTKLKLAQISEANANAAKAYQSISASGQDPATVSGWVTNIKSGIAKLSDLTGNPALKNAVVTALAAGGSSQSQILQTTKQSLDELNAMVNQTQLTGTGFTDAVGNPLLGWTSKIPGSQAADFNAKFTQVKNDVILPNLNLLHGLGRVTDREFQALTAAVTSLNTNESQGQFKRDLSDLTNQINQKLQADSGTQTNTTTAKGLPFDYQAAITAGHTDAEIQAYLKAH